MTGDIQWEERVDEKCVKGQSQQITWSLPLTHAPLSIGEPRGMELIYSHQSDRLNEEEENLCKLDELSQNQTLSLIFSIFK